MFLSLFYIEGNLCPGRTGHQPVLTGIGIERRPEIPGSTLLAAGAGGLEAIRVFASFLART